MSLIMNVFSEWIIKDVLNVLKENNILIIRVSLNTAHIYQLFELKSFMRKQFCKWYSKQILQCQENGSELGSIKVGVKLIKLTVMKPLQLRWLSEFYNYVYSSDGQEINGSLPSGIAVAPSWQLSKYILVCVDQEVSLTLFFV